MVKNSKILVAGGTGFIGSNLIVELISKGNEIISLSTCGNKKNNKEVVYIYHDLTKPIKDKQFKFFSDVDYVVNCSGYIDHKGYLNGGEEVFYNHFKSLYYLANLAIYIKSKEGKDAFLSLVTSADVVVENFRSGVMGRFGLSFEI